MSGADREKWEERYGRRNPGEIGEADPFVSEALVHLPAGGAALDVAGGSGRNALALARHGLEVTVTDISPRGLSLATAAAKREGLRLSTLTLDLDEAPLPTGPFSVVLCSWYLLAEQRWAELARVVAPGGFLVLVHPTTTNLERHDHPSRRFLIEASRVEEEIARLGFVPRIFASGWDDAGKHTVRLVARRPLPDEDESDEG